MSIRILVVDDHALVREGLTSLLKKQADFKVVGEAGDGVEAIQLAETLEPDIIVLDVGMPGMDGIETARRILKSCPGTHILALSMHGEQDFVTTMFAVGANGYILKDSAFKELVNAIRTVIDGQKYISPEMVEVVLESLGTGPPAAYTSKLERLTVRETEILTLIAEGYNSKEIGGKLNISAKTVDTHRQQVMKKLKLFNVADLTKFAIKERLIKL